MRGGPWDRRGEDLVTLWRDGRGAEVRGGRVVGKEGGAVTLVFSKHASILPACRSMALKQLPWKPNMSRKVIGYRASVSLLSLGKGKSLIS